MLFNYGISGYGACTSEALLGKLYSSHEVESPTLANVGPIWYVGLNLGISPMVGPTWWDPCGPQLVVSTWILLSGARMDPTKWG